MGPFNGIRAFFNVAYCLATGLVGYAIHHSILWACLDGLLTPVIWVKWAITHEVNRGIINAAFHLFPK